MATAADALSIVRLAVAATLPVTLTRAVDGSRSRWLPLALVGLGATTDFFDGVLARHAGPPTRHGALLDNTADIALVLAGTGTGAALGLVPWAVPAAIAVAFAAYGVASIGTSARQGEVRLARSRVGHAAGICNYAIAGLIAGAVALPGAVWARVLVCASLAVIAVNLTAVLSRLRPRPREPAPEPRGGESRAR